MAGKTSLRGQTVILVQLTGLWFRRGRGLSDLFLLQTWENLPYLASPEDREEKDAETECKG